MKRFLVLLLMLASGAAHAQFADDTFSYDFSGMGDSNPYVNSAITDIDGGRQIVSGTFRATTTNSTWQRFRYNGAVSGDTMRVSMRVNTSGNENPMGIGFLAADGSGYVVRLTWNAFAFIATITDDRTVTSISGGEEEIPSGLGANGVLTYELTLSTGAHKVFYDQGSGEVEITDLQATNTAYTGSSLAPAILMSTDGGGFNIIAWGADAGGGASPPTLSSPTPSGTLGTETTATVGATSTSSTGDFYAVLSTSNNVSGASCTQIEAGQNSSSASATHANDAAVSTTSPSVGFTGLTGSTLYYYAACHIDANGDSNVVSGSFTTAAADIVATKLIFGSQPGNVVVGQTFGAFTVRAVNASDALDEDFEDDVTVALQTGNGALAGTLTETAVAGIATFDDVHIDTLNTDAVIRATADGLTAADSDEFDVTAGGEGGTAGFPSSSRLGGVLQ